MELMELNVGRRTGVREVGFSRELQGADLAVLAEPRGVLAVAPKTLRASHHNLARLLANGVRAVEASAITGFSQSRISVLQSDPAFKELIAHYKEVVESSFEDLTRQVAALGADAVGELRDRLLDSPESFNNSLLLQVVTALLDRSGHGVMSKNRNENVNITLSSEDLASLKNAAKGKHNGTITTGNIGANSKTAEENLQTILSPLSEGGPVVQGEVKRIEGGGEGL